MKDTTNPNHWGKAGGQWYMSNQEAKTGLTREEDKHDAMFGNRKYDLLEGRVKQQNKALLAMVSAHERQADILNDLSKRLKDLEKLVSAINGAKVGPTIATE